MTSELQAAMARYEVARFAYQRAVLASLQGEGDGAAIRDAVRGLQRATAELAHERRGASVEHRPAPRPVRAVPTLGFVRRMLRAS